MSKRILLAVATATALLTPAAASAQYVDYVDDKPSVTLDPKVGYVILRTQAGMVAPITLMRRPEPDEIEAYRKLRKEALDKAHAKWERRQAAYLSAKADGDKAAPSGRQPAPRPTAPIEPTDANLAYPPIQKMLIFPIGPLGRFSKKDANVFLLAMRPGTYAFYGPIDQFAGYGSCMCMGSVEFDIKPGQILNGGTMELNWPKERGKARAEHRPMPETEMDLPETMTSVSWRPGQPGDTVDPRLAAYDVVPAELHASGPFPNYFGGTIDRLTPIPGVLAYDRDKVIDVRPRKPAK